MTTNNNENGGYRTPSKPPKNEIKWKFDPLRVFRTILFVWMALVEELFEKSACINLGVYFLFCYSNFDFDFSCSVTSTCWKCFLVGLSYSFLVFNAIYWTLDLQIFAPR